MGKSFWIVAILVAALFFWGVGYVVSPASGDAEFQKMMEATTHVKSFRGVYVGSTQNSQHAEKLWELDCNRGILHRQIQELQSATNTLELKDDEFILGGDQKYTRNSDGSWQQSKYTAVQYSASWYCDNLSQGTIRDLLPDFRGMLRSATFGEGDKKTVNGLRCKDWKFTMHSKNSGVRGTVCIGLEDHLPYEMTTDDGGHYSYTDFNRPLQFDGPDAVQQAAAAN